MAKILLKFQDTLLKEYPLDTPSVTIGRKPGNDIVIDNQTVSGYHAKVSREGESLFVEDLGSLNGTFLNGVKISRSPLRHGDSILIGKHLLAVDSPEDAETDPGQMQTRTAKFDETLVLDQRLQQKFLGASPARQMPGDAAEPLGGFIIVEGRTDWTEYELRDRVTMIGKDQGARIRTRGLFLPRFAALVNRRKGGYFISPAAGRAIKVNGNKIYMRYDLKDGDIVEVSGLTMQFYMKA